MPAVCIDDEKSQRLVKLADQRVDGDTITASTTQPARFILLNSLIFDDVLAHPFPETPGQEPGLAKDTDGDGINDFYEKEMASGRLVLGNGVPWARSTPRTRIRTVTRSRTARRFRSSR